MGSNRLALAAAIGLLGCGGSAATVKPDPPLDDAKFNEITLKNLQSEDPVQRMLAVAAFGAKGPAAKAQLPEIKKLEADKDENVRKAVKEAVAKIEKG